MASTAIDSLLLGDFFSTKAMRSIFSDENRIQKYLDVEAALAKVQAELNIIPHKAAIEIQKKAKIENFDFEKLKTQTQLIGLPVLPVIEQFVEICDHNLGEYCHWGATTQDITDTATVLQIRDALDLIEDDLQAISDSLADLSVRYRDTPMMGRSLLQQALPITFGFKTARLLSTIQRHQTRLKELRPRLLVGEFGGAVGTLASLGKPGLQVEAALMKELGLGVPDIPWHAERDCFAEVGCFLGLVTATLGKFALDLKLMMQTEVGEAFEPFKAKRGASSTMPHKRNPISCNFILASASLVRQQVASLLESMLQEHERGAGTWQMEWVVLPEIFLLTSGALAQSRQILSEIDIAPKKLQENIEMTHGLIMAEAVMMGLAPYLGREQAHNLVYAACRKAVEQKRLLIDVLAEMPEIQKHVKRSEIEKWLDPANYLGCTGEFIDRVLLKKKSQA